MTRGRLIVAGLVLAGAAGCLAIGLSRITLDVDITRLLPPDLRETTGFRLLKENFSRRDELIMALEGADGDAVEACAGEIAGRLGQRPDLANRVRWQAGWGTGASNLSEWVAWGLLNRPPAQLSAVADRLAPDKIEATLQQSLEDLSSSLTGEENLMGYDPFGLTAGLMAAARGMNPEASEFASQNGKFRVLYVRGPTRPANYRETGEWLDRIRAVADEVAAPRGIAVRFTGEPAFFSEISRGMESDMKRSAMTALVLIALIVWASFGGFRVVPVLIGCVLMACLVTLAVCGAALGSLTILTIGFGAILIGLSADYGVLIYQAARLPGATPASAARSMQRSILWSSSTTAASFFSLVFAGMPGLAELGLLVGSGVVFGVIIFLVVFPRLLAVFRTVEGAKPLPRWFGRRFFGWPAALTVAGGLAALVAGLLVRGPPRVNADEGSMRPRRSESFETFEKFTEALSGGRNAVTVLVTGNDADEVAERLGEVEAKLEREKSRGTVGRFALPTVVWPDPDNQRTNLSGVARRLVSDEARLREAALAAGFNESALELTSRVFAHWAAWDRAGIVFPLLPADETVRDLLRRFVHVTPEPGGEAAGPDAPPPCLALGVVVPREDSADAVIAGLRDMPGVYLGGQRLMNRTIEEFISTGFTRLAILFTAITFGLLIFALRSWRPLLLTALSLAISLSALLGAMSWLGISWNAFTLPALLLSLGTGSDYFIYVVLDMQRRGGDAPAMRVDLGQGLLVCAATSVIGFGSLAGAQTTGLANLGTVCSLALLLNVLVAVLITPWGWRWVHARRAQGLEARPAAADA